MSGVKGPRHELEPKDDFKKRNGYSPNKADSLSIACEGARRLGLMIEQGEGGGSTEDDDWFSTEADDYRKAIRENLLNHQ